MKKIWKGGGRQILVLFLVSILALAPLSVQAEETDAPASGLSDTGQSAEPTAGTMAADAQPGALPAVNAADGGGAGVPAGVDTPAAAESEPGVPAAAGDAAGMEAPTLTEEELTVLSEDEVLAYQQLLASFQNGQAQQAAVAEQMQFLLTLQEQAALDEAQNGLLLQLSQLTGQLAVQQEQLLSQLTALGEEACRRLEEQKGPEIIFVGDSRFVQMQNAVGDTSYVWIAKSSQGYKWFFQEAVPQIDAAVGRGTRVLLNLGVNDVSNASSYARLVNQKAKEWTALGATVYYASVNPVEDGKYVTAQQVSRFNEKLKKGLDPCVHWIDSYTWLQKTGYSLTDGLHFTNKTYKKLYRFYLDTLMPQGA